ncbi:MAG: transporter substrate-binding domain-containing protein [Blastochloris sp.]|nr:transporter substrate-binding domain-containing protein [Blastochloris sp.]
MRKLMLLVALLALLLAAVGVAVAQEEADAAERAAVYGELPDLDGREIVVAVENLYPPFQFEDTATGQPIGYEYDMLEEICFRLNCVPVYETISFDLLIAAVGEGQYDMGMTGISITEERRSIVDYSASYINLDQFLLVRADEDRFTNLDEFVANDELILGVQSGTSGFFVTDGVVPEDRRVVFNEFGALIAALVAGRHRRHACGCVGGGGLHRDDGRCRDAGGRPDLAR